MQKIFDIDNEEDMRQLWDILPEEVVSVELEELRTINRRILLVYNDMTFCTCPLKIDFKGKEKITRPVNYEDMVDCVGWFWDNENDTKRLGVFKCKDKEYFCDKNESRWMHFTPVKKSELKFWEDKNE